MSPLKRKLDRGTDKEDIPMLIKKGMVSKKISIIKSMKYKLILTNQPRLYLVKENGEYKEDILITPFVKAVSK